MKNKDPKKQQQKNKRSNKNEKRSFDYMSNKPLYNNPELLELKARIEKETNNEQQN